MTRIVHVGSIDIDHVYRIGRFVRPGETLDGRSYEASDSIPRAEEFRAVP